MMQHKSINKTRKKNKRSKVKKYKSSYGKTLKSRLKSNTMTKKNNKKYKMHRGGATPVGTPRTPRTPRTPIGPVTPLTLPGSNISSNAIPTLASVAQQLQDYAYNRKSPYYSPGKRVIPVTELPGMGREKNLSYDQKIHSTGDRFSNEELKQIVKSPLKIVSPKRKSSLLRSSLAPAVDYSVLPYNVPFPTAPPLSVIEPPTPPEAIVTSKGKLKTSYTPKLDIMDFNEKFMSKNNVEIPSYRISLALVKSGIMPVTLPLSYLPNRGSIYDNLTPDERVAIYNINQYNEEYFYLSPNIYSILEKLKLTDHFGTLLVWGNICDALIENVKISSIKTIQSRTLFTEELSEKFLSLVNDASLNTLFNLGPSPSNPFKNKVRDLDLSMFTIPEPKHPPNPSSYQFIGYDKHPMFNMHLTDPDIDNLLTISEQSPPIKKKENVFVLGHGGMGSELPPNLKLLANKHIRLIELASKHTLLGANYPGFYIELCNVLLNPINEDIFNNTDKGVQKRKKVFDSLCQYLSINMFSACYAKDTFNLTDITHDRVLEGDFDDIDVQEDHTINVRTLSKFYSMGIFTPVDYRRNINKIPIYLKKIFNLYPGTTFFTKKTSINLIRTLIQIAVRENKIINVVLFSCSTEYVNYDRFFPSQNLSFKQPDETTPSMKLLINGKKFIYNTRRMISSMLVCFENEYFIKLRLKHGSNNLYEKTHDYFTPQGIPNYNEINSIEVALKTFYNQYFLIFLLDIKDFNYLVAYSFAGLDEKKPSFDLIDDRNPVSNTPYAKELIKVKIYLMEEFYRMFYKVLSYYTTAFYHLLDVYNRYYSFYVNYSPGDINSQSIIMSNINIVKEINDFFSSLFFIIRYVSDGFYGDKSLNPPLQPSFLHYPKYIEVKKEYDQSHIKKIYDEINEGMDYNKYVVIDPYGTTLTPSRGKKVRGLITNQLPPGEFFHTTRNTYEYKELPNVDKAIRRRKEIKKQIFDKQKIRPEARKTRAENDYNISI